MRRTYYGTLPDFVLWPLMPAVEFLEVCYSIFGLGLDVGLFSCNFYGLAERVDGLVWAYDLKPLVHPGLVRLVIFKPVFLDLAKLLGVSAPVVSLATQLMVTAVSFLVAQQTAVLMATAVGQANLLELQPKVLRD